MGQGTGACLPSMLPQLPLLCGSTVSSTGCDRLEADSAVVVSPFANGLVERWQTSVPSGRVHPGLPELDLSRACVTDGTWAWPGDSAEASSASGAGLVQAVLVLVYRRRAAGVARRK